MSRKSWITLVGVAIFLSILACNAASDFNLGGERIRGSGNAVEEVRTLGSLSKVELAMQGTLYIEVGDRESLRIETEDNLLEYIQTDVSGSRLLIRTRTGTNLVNSKPINFYLTVVSLDDIRLTSSGNVFAPDLVAENFNIDISSSGNLSMGSLDCSDLHVDISSSGDVTIPELNADSITVDMSSSGNLDIQNGQVQTQSIRISSSGEYQAKGLASAEADVSLTSSGSAYIRVSDSLSGRLSSSGDIFFIGTPDVNVSTSSSGRPKQIDE